MIIKSIAAIVAFLGGCVLTSKAQEEKDPFTRLQKLGLPVFEKPMPTSYSAGAKSRAAKLALDITAMNGFYQTNLGVEFLKDVKREFPADSTRTAGERNKITPAEALLRLDKIAPGFVKWADVFQDDGKEAKAGAQP